MTILIFIVVLGVLILSHELGHFLAAKLSGVRVLEFGFGFPPKLVKRKIGQTIYSVNLVPFGGFVKLAGEDSESAQALPSDLREEEKFNAQPFIYQAFILVSGVLFNLILVWLWVSFSLPLGLTASPTSAPAGLELENLQLAITEVLAGSPAASAGLSAGDKNISLADAACSQSELTPTGIQEFVGRHADSELILVFERAGEVKEVRLKPTSGLVGGRSALGIGMAEVGRLKLPIHLALLHGGVLTAKFTVLTAQAIVSFAADAFTGAANLESITGPIGIIGLVGEAARLGLVALAMFTAVISINLAVINLVPFPALDGGRLLFLIIEAIKGSPIRPQVAQIANTIGFALLILLMLVVTYNDIARLAS